MWFIFIPSDGLAMGSPLVIYLCFLLKKIYSLFNLCKSLFWFRYVDTFFLIPSDLDLSNLLSLVNYVDHYIQFTIKVEKNNSFPFFSCLGFETFRYGYLPLFKKTFHCIPSSSYSFKPSYSIKNGVLLYFWF